MTKYDKNYYYYCPICGYEMHYGQTHCLYHTNQEFIQSKHTTQWYNNIANERREKENKFIFGIDILKEEYMQNPLFDIEEYNHIHKINSEDYHRKQIEDNSVNQPKCPLCQSTNIHQISLVKRGVHAVSFGLFSTTARSQWECLNCGNKF